MWQNAASVGLAKYLGLSIRAMLLSRAHTQTHHALRTLVLQAAEPLNLTGRDQGTPTNSQSAAGSKWRAGSALEVKGYFSHVVAGTFWVEEWALTEAAVQGIMYGAPNFAWLHRRLAISQGFAGPPA